MGKKNAVTVAQLISALQGLNTPNAVVRMSSDPEGNDIRLLASPGGVSPDSKTQVTLWPGARVEE